MSQPCPCAACATLEPYGVRGWQPDENLIEHVRIAGRSIVDMSGPDRAWAVAGLAAVGWTAEETARQLRCSLRLIKQIRSEPMCIVATYALHIREERLRDRDRAEARASLAAAEMRRLETALSHMTRERDRLLQQIVRRVG